MKPPQPAGLITAEPSHYRTAAYYTRRPLTHSSLFSRTLLRYVRLVVTFALYVVAAESGDMSAKPWSYNWRNRRLWTTLIPMLCFSVIVKHSAPCIGYLPGGRWILTYLLVVSIQRPWPGPQITSFTTRKHVVPDTTNLAPYPVVGAVTWWI